jgi:hypothetical protein
MATTTHPFPAEWHLADLLAHLGSTQELTGSPVLPGFRVMVARLFERMKDNPPSPTRRRRPKKS